MKKALFTLLLLPALASQAFAETASAPNVTFLIEHSAFASGQSNNLGPGIKQVIDNYWILGPCAGAGDPFCDSLRFGLTVGADATCTESNNELIAPQEDGGGLVKARIQSIHNEGGVTWCTDSDFSPHDSVLEDHNTFTYPSGPVVTAPDSYWERPSLSLFVVGEEPQTANNQPDDRVINALKAACDNLNGHGNMLPAQPTWVMLTRKNSDDAEPYANLLAGAGGTASCCYGNNCDPLADAIDVCAHVNDGRTDNDIRQDLQSGKYSCGAGTNKFATGLLDWGGKKPYGQLPMIRCHLVGESNNDNCKAPRKPTDLLGIFSCIRQLPKGRTGDDNPTVTYCGTDVDGDGDYYDDCEILTEGNGIEYIDPNRTLYHIDREDCEVDVTFCVEDLDCTVPGAVGRCAVGKTDCSTGSEVCVAEFEAMPEICNGLDDDCDGGVDNLSDSWENFSEVLPAVHEGLSCFEDDICGCPNGQSDEHAGANFDEYLNNWAGACSCSAGLEENYSTDPNADSDVQHQPLGCSMTGTHGTIPLSPLLLLAGIVLVRRRRKS